MNYKRKLKRIQKEIGYKKISAYISEDNGTLRINNHTFLLHDIANVYVDTVFIFMTIPFIVPGTNDT